MQVTKMGSKIHDMSSEVISLGTVAVIEEA